MSTDLRSELIEVLTAVVGGTPDDIRPEAQLRDLGVDSLALVEISDELGRRIGGWLPDEALIEARTVGDLERIARTNAETPPPVWARQAGSTAHATVPPDAVRKLALSMAFIGGLIGIAAGTIGVMGSNAVGLPDFRMPPLAQPSVAATPSTGTDEGGSDQGGSNGGVDQKPGSDTPSDDSGATLTTSAAQVAAGERFTLFGTFSGLGAGEVLQVQRRTATTDWEDFPVTPTTRAKGTFSTEVSSSDTGDYKFRVRHAETNTATPAVVVAIG